MKNDCVTLDAVPPVLPLDFPPCAREQAFEPDQAAAFFLLENKEVFSVDCMVADGGVARYHLHIANLAFASVPVRSVRLGAVVIANLTGGVPGEQKNARDGTRRGYPSVLLATVGQMNIRPADVRLINDKRPMHTRRNRLLRETATDSYR